MPSRQPIRSTRRLKFWSDDCWEVAPVRELAAQRSAADQSPVMQALIAFLNAHDEAAARRVFERHHDTLDSQDAQNTIEQAFAGGNAESQQRIDERARLLRSLRSPSS